MGEVNWLCRQAGRVNKQSSYLDVYAMSLSQTSNSFIKKDEMRRLWPINARLLIFTNRDDIKLDENCQKWLIGSASA